MTISKSHIRPLRFRPVKPPSGVLRAAALFALSCAMFGDNSAFSANTLAVPAGTRDMDSPPALRKGINLSAWLAEPLRQTMYTRDLKVIEAAGFDFVRLPVAPKVLHFNISGTTPVEQELDFTATDKAIAMISAAGLATVLDIHPDETFMQELEKGGKAEDRFVEFWSALAAHYNGLSARLVSYELLNEPQYYNHSDHYNMVAIRLLLAIRKVDPKRLVIIEAPAVSDSTPTQLIRSMQALVVQNDANVAYDVHYYMPPIITHQGAPFAFQGTQIPNFRHLPYPSSLVDKAHIMLAPAADQDAAKSEVDRYVAQRWDRTHIEAFVLPAAEWAKEHHVRMLVLEFGVLRLHIDPDSRYRWIADVRRTFDASNIGWAVWDYADCFGIARYHGETTMDNDGALRFVHPETGIRTIEPAALDALGLRSAATK